MIKALAALLLIGCTGAATGPKPPRAQLGAEVVFEGMCDASGAVALSAQRLVAADDEDNVLRVYDADRGGPPQSSVEMSPALGLPLVGKRHPHHPEVDLEAAALDGDRAYWLASHGRSAKGKLKDERLKFFATTINDHLELIGSYDHLLDDLIADARYDRFGLTAASELPPKEPGGLNIEGMTTATDGSIFIGFRNPIPGGKALVAPLRNAAAVVEEPAGTRARFGAPMLLDLAGQGIRSLSWWRGRYLIVAGDSASGGIARLYTWDGHGAPAIVDVDLTGYNPEGFFSPEERDEILLLSDDGSVLVDGVRCKELEDVSRRSFRGRWLRL